jgi:hypothetical protein
MNSTVLALLLLTGLNALPEQPTAPSPQPPAVGAVSSLQPLAEASRWAAKGRRPQERLQLRMEQRIASATTAP